MLAEDEARSRGLVVGGAANGHVEGGDGPDHLGDATGIVTEDLAVLLGTSRGADGILDAVWRRCSQAPEVDHLGFADRVKEGPAVDGAIGDSAIPTRSGLLARDYCKLRLAPLRAACGEIEGLQPRPSASWTRRPRAAGSLAPGGLGWSQRPASPGLSGGMTPCEVERREAVVASCGTARPHRMPRPASPGRPGSPSIRGREGQALQGAHRRASMAHAVRRATSAAASRAGRSTHHRTTELRPPAASGNRRRGLRLSSTGTGDAPLAPLR